MKLTARSTIPASAGIVDVVISAPKRGTPASIRTIVLQPSRFLEQKVAVTGQFSGRNLLGDLPDAPAKSRYDFVLRNADAALWVINMRPRPDMGTEPYAIAVVQLDEGPRMMTNIINCPQTPEALQLDMPVKVSFTKMSDAISLPLFEPAKA